jgi:hypothetical protein
MDYSSNVKKLLQSNRRQFPRLLKDLEEAFSRIEQDYQKAANAAAISGFNQTVWKYRCKCSDLQRGASGGIKIIAFFKAETNTLYPLTLYFKKDKSDITAQEIGEVVTELLAATSQLEE